MLMKADEAAAALKERGFAVERDGDRIFAYRDDAAPARLILWPGAMGWDVYVRSRRVSGAREIARVEALGALLDLLAPAPEVAR